MFANLPDHEREAFFDIMDEYFAQRPQLDPVLIAEELAQARAEGAAAPATTDNTTANEHPDAIGYAEALYPYPKNETEDLELAKGERIVLLERISDDWWRGRSMDGYRREGIVPSAAQVVTGIRMNTTIAMSKRLKTRGRMKATVDAVQAQLAIQRAEAHRLLLPARSRYERT